MQIHRVELDCRTVKPTTRVFYIRADLWRGSQSRGHQFTSEDVCQSVGRPSDPKAIGGLFRRWAKAGYIREVDITTATRHQRHNGTLRVWQIQ
jgi:uncharacterized protein YmfQ (DUF2313 family)